MPERDEFNERLLRNMRDHDDVLAKLAETDGPDAPRGDLGSVESCDQCGKEGPTAEWLAHDLCGPCLRIARDRRHPAHPGHADALVAPAAEEDAMNDETRGVPLVRYGLYKAKGNVPEHSTYVELAVARAWNYRDDPDTIGYDLAEARLLEAVAEAARDVVRGYATSVREYEAQMALKDAIDALAAHRALLDGGRREGA